MTGPKSLYGEYPHTRDGVPSQDRTVEGVLATRRVVCPLRSRRRTFLFLVMFLRTYRQDALLDNFNSDNEKTVNITYFQNLVNFSMF